MLVGRVFGDYHALLPLEISFVDIEKKLRVGVLQPLQWAKLFVHTQLSMLFQW